MPGHQSPPPGSMPPGVGSPDMASMEDMLAAQAGATAPGTTPSSSHTPTSPIGSPVQEAKSIATGVGQEIFEFLPPVLKNLISFKPDDTPEAAARKRQMLQNYQKLNAEDQQFVQKKLQQEQMEKRQREEEEHQRKQMMASQQQDFPVPEGKKTGEAAMGGGNSQKSQTISKLQNDRKKMSSSG